MTNKESRRIIRTLESQGFTVQRTAKGRWLIRNPEGRAIATIADKPGEYRAWRNALSVLKRAGLVWPPPKR